jgi:tricorn protease
MFNRVLSVLILAGALRADTKLLRFPDIHADKVVFTYAGDLWTAPVAGGPATPPSAPPRLQLIGKLYPHRQLIAINRH